MANLFDQFDAPDAQPRGSPLEAALQAEGLTGPAADVARSIYQQESSSGRNTRTSNAGAVGGMQIKPSTFARFADKGWSIDDPVTNARAAVRYLRSLAAQTGNDPRLMAVGYYGGEGAIPKARRGEAVADPRNPGAPTTLEYADQVTRRLSKTTAAAKANGGGNPFDQFDAAPAQSAAPAVPPSPEPPPHSTLAELGRQVGLTGRAAVTGLMGLPNILADAATAGANIGAMGVNALAGTHLPELILPSQATQNLLTMGGAPEPVNATERVAQDIASSMAGAGGLAGLAGRGAAAAVANPLVRQTLATLGENLGTQVVSGAAGGGATGATREAGGGSAAQFLAGVAGGAMPLGVRQIMTAPDRATRNAAQLLREAAAKHSPADWNKARELLTESQRVGVPLLGPEALPAGSPVQQLASDVAASPASKNKLAEFVQPRAEQVAQAGFKALTEIGKRVGPQEAANAAQEAADEVVRKAQQLRTQAAGPGYQAQRAEDIETMDLSDQLAQLPRQIEALSDSRASTVQAAGKLHQFTNEQLNLANRTIKRQLGWAGDVKAGRNLAAAEQGKQATQEAVNRGLQYASQLHASEQELLRVQDALAQRNLPAVTGKVNSFLAKLDQDIRAANPDTTEGQILRRYRDELAPHGEPITLPSQLESIYKANRDKTQLGLNPSALEKTTAGVIGKHLGALDSLIQDVSPAIRNARTVYAQLSQELVDPLLKGPVGRLAGRGADAQKEAVRSRVMTELSGKDATPDRINLLADKLGTVDKTVFPNLVRAHLEEQLNQALKPERGRIATLTGISFRDALEGTPQQRANLEAMVRQVARAQGQDPELTYQGFRGLMDVLDATGRLLSSRAPTKGGTAATAGQVATDLVIDLKTAGAKTIINTMKDWTRRRTYARLADVFTDPDSVKKMQQLAELAPSDPKRVQQAASLLRATQTKPAGDDSGE